MTEEGRRKAATVKSEKLKVFFITDYGINKIYSAQFHLLCWVNLTYFYFFILGFQLSILQKLKNTLNCHLKLNSDNNQSFQVNYSPDITILFIKTNKK